MSPTGERVDAEPADCSRLVHAVQGYLAELEAGRRPDRLALAARHPDLAEAMAPYLDALDLVHAAGPLLELPREGRPAPPPGQAIAAEPLGDFRIVRELGRGGMGTVYEAVQLSLGRRVALKVLPFAAALDAKQLQRFKNEAQAAANLHHTNIVPVYAVGCERGVHFYAMQLIEGQNLATLLESLREGLPAGPGSPRPAADATGPYPAPPAPVAGSQADTRSGLGALLLTQRSNRAADYFRTVARLAAQVAEGLDYAHGAGIVHRDIKPANLLVDDRGTVWITDFGLAQFHADAGLTQTGDLLGTLRYMSPEQAGGRRVLIDHRADVYSLGATLYESLTLRPIFEGGDRQTLLHQILHEEPRPPRAIDRSIPAELETIVLKAVGKSPADRYATAGDLAEDLHRFLRFEPIRARRATAAQWVRKWFRRHPLVPIAGAVLLALLAAGSLVSTWIIRGEQEKTRLAYDAERRRAEQAEDRFRLARRAVDQMIQLAQEELDDRPHLQGPRKRLLAAALTYYQEFIEQRRDDPDAQAELATTQARVQKIVDDLSVLEGSARLDLLGDPAVLDDLNASAEQRERVAEVSHRQAGLWHAFFGEFRKLTAEQRRQGLLDLARGKEAAVTALLTPGQRARFQQIMLQLRGAGAFREAEIAAELRLTAEQRERLRALEEGRFGWTNFKGPGGPPKSSEEKLAATRDRIRAVLTDGQAKKWQGITGKPFKGLARPGGPFPRPAHPEPGRPGRGDPGPGRS